MPSARFHLAVRALHRPHLDLDAMIRVVQRHAQDAEGIAVIAMIARLLNQRARVIDSLTDLDRLLTALPARAAVKRYAKALEILDRHQAHLDEFDELLLMLSATNRDVEWLEEAVSSLQGVGRPITRLMLIRLRSWAPDMASLGQYMRGVRSLSEAGLEDREIDTLMHACLKSEETTAIAGMIGHVGKRLFDGRLTLAKAERLLHLLNDRAAVLRYERALATLLSAGLDRSEAEGLAEAFSETKDDFSWLEACVRHMLTEDGRLSPDEIRRLKEQYPDVSLLYRYVRLREHIRPFTAIPRDEFEQLAQDIVPVEGYERILLGLLEALRTQGRQDAATIEDVQDFLARLAVIAELPPLHPEPELPEPDCNCPSCRNRRERLAQATTAGTPLPGELEAEEQGDRGDHHEALGAGIGQGNFQGERGSHGAAHLDAEARPDRVGVGESREPGDSPQGIEAPGWGPVQGAVALQAERPRTQQGNPADAVAPAVLAKATVGEAQATETPGHHAEGLLGTGGLLGPSRSRKEQGQGGE